MYAEVYKWFTETSRLGLMEQAAKPLHPKQAAKEYHIAEGIELWEEHVNRLARQRRDYHLPNVYGNVAFKRMLVGEIRDNVDLWQAEKLPFDEILKKVKEKARSNKLDADVSRRKAGATMGNNNAEYPGLPHVGHDGDGHHGHQCILSEGSEVGYQGQGQGSR